MNRRENCFHNHIVAEPLTKQNYGYWVNCVRNYLIAQDLWEVVDGTTAEPSEDRKKEFVRWRKKNAAALHVILISCGTDSFSPISQVSEAKAAWNILNDAYKSESESERESNPLSQVRAGEEVNFDVAELYKAICDNDWIATKEFIDKHPSALQAKFTCADSTAIHLAASLGHMDIVEKLVGLVAPEYLQTLDGNGYTALEVVAFCTGDTQVAQCMVNKNRKILGFSTAADTFPFSLAISRSHNEMGRYLYSVTPLDVLKREGSARGLVALYSCLNGGELGIALDLLQQCPDLLSADFHSPGWKAVLKKIAAMPFAFSRGSELVFWKRWIYNCGGLLSKLISYAYNMLGMKGIYELRLADVQAAQILSVLCAKVRSLDSSMSEETHEVFDAICRAVREGNVEFVVEVSKANPQLITWLVDGMSGWNTFFYAVANRQAEVLNLIHGLRFKAMLAPAVDHFGNTMLHVAAELAPSSQLNRISGPAFQMQSELQWFKEVESVVPQGYRVRQNNEGKKPDDIFKESHKELRKEGEKWMKETASSCSVVGALVVTIMFAAAFTVPGGNNQEFGYPIFLEEQLFLLYVVSDAFSLFSSTTSVLIFLGIFTSRYAEEDFLKSLPTKLIIGLSTLFLSIATMMIAFSATILLMLPNRPHSWVYLPIVMLASIPVILFVLLQIRLLFRMVSSTYCPGIFNRNVKPWL